MRAAVLRRGRMVVDDVVDDVAELTPGPGQALVEITGQVDLDETPAAFTALANPEEHLKIMVRPNGPG